MSDAKQMSVEEAVEIIQSEEWSGDMRVIATKLSSAGCVLVRERERLRGIQRDLSSVEFAAKVPPGYQHGLAAWITDLVARAASAECPRTEDVEEIERLEREQTVIWEQLNAQASALAEAKAARDEWHRQFCLKSEEHAAAVSEASRLREERDLARDPWKETT